MPANQNIALITGATGFIGFRIVSRLIAENIAVRILMRGCRPLPAEWENRGEVIKGDLTNIDEIKTAVKKCHVVFHCAAETRDRTRMRDVNVTGVKNLLDACEEENVGHIVYLSSVGVMGARKNGIVDETFPCAPRSEYERTKFDAETLIRIWSKKTGMPVAVMRPTIVFGEKKEPDSMICWLRAIKNRRFVFIDPKAQANYVYIDDVARACALAYKKKANGIFIVSDSCSLIDFVGAASRALQVPAPRKILPYPAAYAAALTMQIAGILLRRSTPFNLSRLHALSNHTRFQSATIADILGWCPETGYRDGLMRTVEWYRKRGEL